MTTPNATLGVAHDILRRWQAEPALAGLGIASFDLLRLDRNAGDFGHMLPTPKPGWSGADILGALAGTLTCPVAIDIDVNAAALAEARWGAGAQTLSDCLCYITIGMGLGGGFALNAAALHGAMQPELGISPFVGRKEMIFRASVLFMVTLSKD
jgi:fructokinase